LKSEEDSRAPSPLQAVFGKKHLIGSRIGLLHVF